MKKRKRLWMVWHQKMGRWQVVVRVKGKRYYLGSFRSVVDAVVERNRWLREQLGGLLVAWKMRQRKDGRGRVVVGAGEVEGEGVDAAAVEAAAAVMPTEEEQREVEELLGSLESILGEGEENEPWNHP